MTDPNEIDQASLDRIARLQERRQPRDAPATPKPRSGRRRRRHPAASGRVLAAGLGATTMFGITAALTVEATADTSTESDTVLAGASVLPTETVAAPAATVPVAAGDELPFEGELPPGFIVDDIDIDSIPEGGVLTGELSDDGRPVVVVFHPRTTPDPAAAAAAPVSAPAATAAPAAPVVAAPTPLTATRVVTEIAVPTPAAAPAPVVTTSGS